MLLAFRTVASDTRLVRQGLLASGAAHFDGVEGITVRFLSFTKFRSAFEGRRSWQTREA